MLNKRFVGRDHCITRCNKYMTILIHTGKYSKYCDVPDEEFRSWLDSLLGQEVLNKEQTNEVRRQLTVRLVSRARNDRLVLPSTQVLISYCLTRGCSLLYLYLIVIF